MSPKKTILDLHELMRSGEKAAWMTAYDAPTAACAESAGMDLLLVGDSLGMVVLGYENTLPVTMDVMIVVVVRVVLTSVLLPVLRGVVVVPITQLAPHEVRLSLPILVGQAGLDEGVADHPGAGE